MALEAGFRKFDTAEADYWHNQKSVGRALEEYFKYPVIEERECAAALIQNFADESDTCSLPKDLPKCGEEDVRVSTKIPPWSMTSFEDIRQHARDSRTELVGFCDDPNDNSTIYPLDVYYIHAPECWESWHPRCKDSLPDLLNLTEAWKAMEAIVAIDHSAQRIGVSNVHSYVLEDLIKDIKERQKQGDPNARMPDVLQYFADPIQPSSDERAICSKYGIEFVAYSTLGRNHPDKSKENHVLSDPIVQGIAAKHGRSEAEVVLSWALQHKMSVIPRSKTKEHIEQLANMLTDDPTFLDDEDGMAMNEMAYTIL